LWISGERECLTGQPTTHAARTVSFMPGHFAQRHGRA